MFQDWYTGANPDQNLKAINSKFYLERDDAGEPIIVMEVAKEPKWVDSGTYLLPSLVKLGAIKCPCYLVFYTVLEGGIYNFSIRRIFPREGHFQLIGRSGFVGMINAVKERLLKMQEAV